jgi:asparagine synthase (glutamine-hydrolysing)
LWLSPCGRVGLGHARLSIIDLETGAQPIASEDERLHIVVNGEFYGFEHIRGELETKGHRFGTRTDSEIALHLYEEVGAQCLHHLRGEFAFILWDEVNQILFAARDRFGIKPLFYALTDEALHLASEAKALFAAGVPARWDHEAYFQQLFVYQNQDRTLFENIRQVPPGHYLLATPNHLQLVRYWDLDYPKKRCIRQRSERDYIEELSHTLNEAVRIRLRADVPVGSFLSGGVDSSAVLGMAARHSSTPLHSFTVVFDQKDYDEGAIARASAAHVGAKFHALSISQMDIANHLGDAIEHAETLGVNWHGVARYLLCRNIHESGYKVVLTGEGSDEIFAGYMQARQDLLIHQRNSAGTDDKAGGVIVGQPFHSHLPAATSEWLAFTERVLGFTPSWLKRLAINRAIFHLLLHPD